MTPAPPPVACFVIVLSVNAAFVFAHFPANFLRWQLFATG
jgi:hypothetical protein